MLSFWTTLRGAADRLVLESAVPFLSGEERNPGRKYFWDEGDEGQMRTYADLTNTA